MRLHELFEESDEWGVYGKAAPVRVAVDGSQSPLTGQGDASWQRDKNNIFNWFKRPFLTNGSRGNYRLPVKKKAK
jgi:hypothetical protein